MDIQEDIYNDDMKGDDAPIGLGLICNPRNRAGFVKKLMYVINDNGIDQACGELSKGALNLLQLFEDDMLKWILDKVVSCAEQLLKEPKIMNLSHIALHTGVCLFAYLVSFIIEVIALWYHKANGTLIKMSKTDKALKETNPESYRKSKEVNDAKNTEMFKKLVWDALWTNFGGFIATESVGITILTTIGSAWPSILSILIGITAGLFTKYSIKYILNREKRGYWRAMKLLKMPAIHRTISRDKLKRKKQSALEDVTDTFIPGYDPLGWKEWGRKHRLQDIEFAYKKMQKYIEIRHKKIKGKELTLADEMDNYLNSSSCIIL